VSDLLLPEGARLVHIGPPKTGSTAVQVAMAGAREAMAAHGAYYPKGPYRRRKAGWALGLQGAPRGMEVPFRHWQKLVDEVRAAGPARVCVSDENYARARREQVERIVRDLGDTGVHVLAVARRLDRLLPSYWQERVKMGYTGAYETWLEAILGDDRENGETWRFWQSQDTGRLIERWLEFLAPDRFTLVVGDEGDRLQLFGVLSAMLGLPEGVLRPDPSGSNESLSWSEVELLRSLEAMYRENDWPTAHFGEKLRPVIDSLRARRDRPTGPRTPPLPAWALDRVRTLSDERADAVAELPVRVVGDLDSLRVVDAPGEGAKPEDLGLPVALVVGAIEGMLRAERVAAEEERAAAVLEDRPAGELSGRELLRLAQRRLGRRLRRN
jgi:hypothetical protein